MIGFAHEAKNSENDRRCMWPLALLGHREAGEQTIGHATQIAFGTTTECMVFSRLLTWLRHLESESETRPDMRDAYECVVWNSYTISSTKKTPRATCLYFAMGIECKRHQIRVRSDGMGEQEKQPDTRIVGRPDADARQRWRSSPR